MPGRKYDAGSGYRYGFNGKEDDKDINEGDIDFGERIYDERIGRWLSLDPLQKKYPFLNPYNFDACSPLMYLDLEGKDVIKANPNVSWDGPTPTFANDLGITNFSATFSFKFNTTTNQWDMMVQTTTQYSSVLKQAPLPAPTTEYETNNPGLTQEVQNHECGHQDQVFEQALLPISVDYDGKKYSGRGDVVFGLINSDIVKKATAEADKERANGNLATQADYDNFLNNKKELYKAEAGSLISNKINEKITNYRKLKGDDWLEKDANKKAARKAPLIYAGGKKPRPIVKPDKKYLPWKPRG